ncbi:hypothetical protein WOLCODRAFT_139674 [Wolfiporia cocos MD-104 SS10]|uniref:Secreted protein n=1 Tax=Wolfiporia cocos (strain MD-104) TaxID=742152 RepID=A0A2H3J8B2_WOLCO|nr:hypothetical protein WOLCODRAFT_139674 [Wolfiporia cocos MD-104 SS10]
MICTLHPTIPLLLFCARSVMDYMLSCNLSLWWDAADFRTDVLNGSRPDMPTHAPYVSAPMQRSSCYARYNNDMLRSRVLCSEYEVLLYIPYPAPCLVTRDFDSGPDSVVQHICAGRACVPERRFPFTPRSQLLTGRYALRQQLAQGSRASPVRARALARHAAIRARR